MTTWTGVPTTDPVLLAGILGIAILLFIRKEKK
ncbi:VPXXXP-CTERM sorting domain-containing protein [Methanohalobium evestigatum]